MRFLFAQWPIIRSIGLLTLEHALIVLLNASLPCEVAVLQISLDMQVNYPLSNMILRQHTGLFGIV
jgi:hypothetical protein